MELQRDIKMICFSLCAANIERSGCGGPFPLGLGNVILIPLCAGFGWDRGSYAKHTLEFWSQGLFSVLNSASEELPKNLGGAWPGQVT